MPTMTSPWDQWSQSRLAISSTLGASGGASITMSSVMPWMAVAPAGTGSPGLT
ncbi:MAG: hypothetical protein WCA31_10875 [Acidimicrobiales bacterium]